ncbi:MAG: nickel pincer cofactor-dependent isomerase, group 22 [Anaerolineae bacterium]
MTDEQGVVVTRRSLDGLRMYVVRQRWEQQEQLANVAAEVERQLSRCGLRERVRPGDEIAIAAGSRGIAALPEVLRAVVAYVRACDGVPFLFPAMGSHGGGTAEGQRALLADLGIREETIGAPVRATMDVVPVGTTSMGLPVVMDAIAAKADGIILVNRIKKHTNFDGAIQSGLCKMAAIGMGKHVQAVRVHSYGNRAFPELIPSVAEVVFAQGRVLAGLAIVENAMGGVAELAGLRADEIIAREPALLEKAQQVGAKIPFKHVDVGIVERLGKDVSGTGLDCYVIGRKRIIGEPEWPETPSIHSLVVLDLTEATHGNAVGIGLADFTTSRLVDKIDWRVTQANIMTSGNMERGKIPLFFASDRDAVEAAAFRERATSLPELRVLAIRDTLHLRNLLVSEALAQEARQRDDLEVVGEAVSLGFDGEGNWISRLDDGV